MASRPERNSGYSWSVRRADRGMLYCYQGKIRLNDSKESSQLLSTVHYSAHPFLPLTEPSSVADPPVLAAGRGGA